MGLRAALRLTTATLTPYPSPLTAETLPADVALAFGVGPGISDRVTRTEAMSIPAVRRGRLIICGTIGTLPLESSRPAGAGDPTAERRLLETLDPNTTPSHLLTWTVDDLLFGGVSWWHVTERDWTTYPVAVERITAERVLVHAGRAYVDGVRVDDADLIRFDGPDEGLITGTNGRSLRTSLLLEDAVRRNARQDVPLGVLRLADGAPELSTEPGSAGDGSNRSQVDALLDAWEDARRDRSTAYLNRAVDYTALQFDAQRTQLAEARNYQATEIGRLLNLPASYLDAPSGSSMTYSNTESRRRDLVDMTLLAYLAPIEQRLSMGDVTPRGWRVRFNLRAFLRGDVTQAVESASKATGGAPVMTVEESRVELLGLPAVPVLGELPAIPAPAAAPLPTGATP